MRRRAASRLVRRAKSALSLSVGALGRPAGSDVRSRSSGILSPSHRRAYGAILIPNQTGKANYSHGDMEALRND